MERVALYVRVNSRLSSTTSARLVARLRRAMWSVHVFRLPSFGVGPTAKTSAAAFVSEGIRPCVADSVRPSRPKRLEIAPEIPV